MNFIVYRYADLLLTLAEAANELGGAHTREAVGYVNEVLFRARNASNEQRTEPADWTQACRRRRYAPPCASNAAAN